MTIAIIDRITEKIFGSSLAVKVERELADEQFAARQALGQEKEDIEARLTALQRTIADARAPFLTQEAALESQLHDLRAARQELEQRHRIEYGELDNRLLRVRGELEWSAPAELTTFIKRLRDEVAVTQSRRDDVVTHGADGRDYEQWSNRASVRARVNAVLETIGAATDLRLEVMAPEALAERLEALWSALPAVDQRPLKYSLTAGEHLRTAP